jgi:hypothetical protein
LNFQTPKKPRDISTHAGQFMQVFAAYPSKKRSPAPIGMPLVPLISSSD